MYLSLVDQPQIEIGHHSSITIGGFILYTDTLVMTGLVLAIIGALVYLARRKGITEDAPTGVQNVLEMAIEFVSGLVEDGWKVLHRPIALPRGITGPIMDAISRIWAFISQPISLSPPC